MKARIVVLPGDGIGVDVAEEGIKVLNAVALRYKHSFTYEKHLVGGCAIDQLGVPLTDATLDACKSADAVLLGAVGGPKWDDPNAKVRPEQGLLKLRAGLGLFANLRPVKMIPQIAGSSPLKKDRIKGVDILVVRELTGGLYFGEPRLRETVNGITRAVDSLVYTEPEIRRVVDLAFRLAQGRRRKVTSVDKANILETSRLWRQIATEISKKYPDVAFENQLVDSAAMRLITAPGSFDVIVTENMFGDILTDEASVISGSLGMLPSASLGEGRLGMYEPIHGSAPDIAGKNIANPIGTILSVAMLLRNSLGLEREARAVERAVERAIRSGARTRDLAAENTLSTTEMGDIICSYIAR